MTVKYLALSVEYLLLHGQQFSCSILCNFYLVSLIRFLAVVFVYFVDLQTSLMS